MISLALIKHSESNDSTDDSIVKRLKWRSMEEGSSMETTQHG